VQFEVTILGSNGAVPAFDRHPSAQIVNFNGHSFLVDCGEATQFQMNRFNIKRGKLDHIFISHLHGDHYFGLLGLITSFHLNYRHHPLHIYGPRELGEIINLHLKCSQTMLRFEIYFHPLKADLPRLIYEDDHLEVETIILKHRLPTTGFLFREKRGLLNIKREKIQEYNISVEDILKIKNGEDLILADGTIVPNAELTHTPRPPRSFAYCADTVYNEDILSQIAGVDLLYHEATFIDEHKDRAVETMHSTARQAAIIAQKANVKELLIGHFSARYENLNLLLNEAKQEFDNTLIAVEGETFQVGNSSFIIGS
jgi:ribonuclease Z